MAVLRSVKGGAPDRVDGFELAYVTRDGEQARVALAEAWSLRLERAEPVRRFASYRGQRHLPGRWWSATDQRHVGYESWLERDHLAAFDFDPEVVAIASQPFWLFWTSEAGKTRSHAPDFFLRRGDGSAVVVDCRPAKRRRPRDLAVFATTRRACELAGWEYRLVGALDPVLTANVRWLAAYRRLALTGARAVRFEATAPGQVRQMADVSGGRAADDGHDAAGSPLEPIDAGRNALLSRELDCHLPAALIRGLLGPFNYGCGHRALAGVLSGCLTGTMPSGCRR